MELGEDHYVNEHEHVKEMLAEVKIFLKELFLNYNAGTLERLEQLKFFNHYDHFMEY